MRLSQALPGKNSIIEPIKTLLYRLMSSPTETFRIQLVKEKKFSKPKRVFWVKLTMTAKLCANLLSAQAFVVGLML